MFNLVEAIAGDDEHIASPCEFGNIIKGHACYCHHESGPRKCHVWRQHGEDASAWNQEACRLFRAAKKEGGT